MVGPAAGGFAGSTDGEASLPSRRRPFHDSRGAAHRVAGLMDPHGHGHRLHEVKRRPGRGHRAAHRPRERVPIAPENGRGRRGSEPRAACSVVTASGLPSAVKSPKAGGTEHDDQLRGGGVFVGLRNAPSTGGYPRPGGDRSRSADRAGSPRPQSEPPRRMEPPPTRSAPPPSHAQAAVPFLPASCRLWPRSYGTQGSISCSNRGPDYGVTSSSGSPGPCHHFAQDRSRCPPPPWSHAVRAFQYTRFAW